MEITELKKRLSIIEVAERLGIKADRYGRALCPFHDDKSPSLQLSREKNIATCFSSRCDAGTMDIIGLTERYLKLSTHEALLKLSEWAGEVAKPSSQGSASNHNDIHDDVTSTPTFVDGLRPKPMASDEPSADTLERIAILTKAFFYFENGMKTSSRAKQYLESRGLTQETPTQKGTETGFNSGNFHKTANKNLITTALKYGLIYPGKARDSYVAFAKDSLVFPLKNQVNKITGLYFRSIDNKAENRHFYLKDRKGLYPGYPKSDTTRLILTEAVIDAATLAQLPDIKNHYQVLACYGTNGLTGEHLAAIRSLTALKEIIIFFDGDPSGRETILRLSQSFHQLLPRVKITSVDTPDNEDINSLYVAHRENAIALFKQLLSERKEVDTTGNTPVKADTFLFSTENPSDEKKKAQADINKKAPEPESAPASVTAPTGRFNTSNPNLITYVTETALYHVKGGLRGEFDRLQVSLMIEAVGRSANYNRYRNRLDLYENKQVERLSREAADKLSLRADLVELDLHRLTDLLEDYREKQLNGTVNDSPRIMPGSSLASRCRAFLEKPGLIRRFNGLIGEAGVVGEENNRIFLFCIAASCRMPDTLHALIQGSSGSGKTHLLAMISNLIPPEDLKRFTRVTESSFYNYGMYDLKNKLICLEDLDGMKEEAQLALRELQSRQMLASSTTGQDEKGNSRAYEKIVYGPIASIACTTWGEIYEDNMSRCFLIAVDETSEQTQRIIAYQNQKASGRIDQGQENHTAAFIQNCLRMLKPYQVINPYADKVQLPPEAHKIRRLNDLYQSFVRQVTLMNQYRRKKDAQGRLVTEKEDLEVAAEIMFESIVLKVDELDGSLRHFYEELKAYVKAKGGEHFETYNFGQSEVRHALNLKQKPAAALHQ